jgi:hypothetical protein
MDFLKKYKTALISLAIIIVTIFAYRFFRGEDVPADQALYFEASSAGQIPLSVGQDILFALEELRRLKLDTTIFESPAFQSLVDWSIATTSEPLGRPDPFETLPSLESEQ